MKKILFSLIIIFFTIINVNAEDDNYLVNLSVTGYNISPVFDKDTYDYIISVKDNVSNITINAEAFSPDSLVTGTGKVDINNESSTFLITVTKDSDTKTYKLKVIQTEANNYLKSLKVGKYELDQPFDRNTFSYSVTVPYEVTNVFIPAIAESETSTVTVKGNNNLAVGENNVIITVTSDTGKSRIYEITVFRLEESDTVTNNLDDPVEDINAVDDQDKQIEIKGETSEINNHKTINYNSIILICSLVIILIGGGIGIYHFSKQKGETEEEIDKNV